LKIGAIGNYNLQEPTDKQIKAIAELIGWALQEFDLKPDRIYGHDDWANTSGPGFHIRTLLDDGTLLEQESN
jgi:N-acetyl-anhydromuramyl-L-alanine amidase AmpD